MPLLLILILWPVVEIALFIKVGGWLGLLPTLVLVFGAGAVGVWIVRLQGLSVVADLRGRLDHMSDPTAPLAHGALLALAALLFMVPGFFSDLLGLALLVPAVRRRIIRRMAIRSGDGATRWPQEPGTGAYRTDPSRPTIIDAEYFEVEVEAPHAPRRPSGWTQH